MWMHIQGTPSVQSVQSPLHVAAESVLLTEVDVVSGGFSLRFLLRGGGSVHRLV